MDKRVYIIRVAILAATCLYCIVQVYSISGRLNKPEKIDSSSLIALASNYAAESAYQEQQDKAHMFGVVGVIALAMALPDIMTIRNWEEDGDEEEI